jgi:hypothetical protein
VSDYIGGEPDREVGPQELPQPLQDIAFGPGRIAARADPPHIPRHLDADQAEHEQLGQEYQVFGDVEVRGVVPWQNSRGTVQAEQEHR